MNKADLTKDGKFYNTEKATLLMVSEFINSYGIKRRAWYKSKTGIFFQTFQYVKLPYNKFAFKNLTIDRDVHKEEIIGECTFDRIRGLFEISDQGGEIGIDSGAYSFCVLRNQSVPMSKIAIANRPKEFLEVEEV
jgi:hypothetical protein